jgi:hypothetical protein
METFLLLVFVLVIAALFAWFKGSPDRRGSTPRVSTKLVVDRRTGESVDVGNGEYEQEVHGESHYQNALATIAGGKEQRGKEFECQAILEREPSNRYDKNAVKVTVNNLLVGYLPREDAEIFCRWATRKGAVSVTCNALVVGGWHDDKSEGSYGIRLDIRIR